MKAINTYFENAANAIAKFTGSTSAFTLAFCMVLLWAVTGPIFDYSQTWQLLINTGTTIITFLMVFLIQKAQNKDSLAMQIKLNELLAAHESASNRIVGAEDMSQEELEVLERFYCRLARLAKERNQLIESHSIDKAEELHEEKMKVNQDQD